MWRQTGDVKNLHRSHSTCLKTSYWKLNLYISLSFLFSKSLTCTITAISQRVFKLWHSNFGVTVSVHAHFLYDDVNRSDGSAVYLTAKADKTSVPALAPFLTLRVSLSQSMM